MRLAAVRLMPACRLCVFSFCIQTKSVSCLCYLAVCTHETASVPTTKSRAQRPAAQHGHRQPRFLVGKTPLARSSWVICGDAADPPEPARTRPLASHPTPTPDNLPVTHGRSCLCHSPPPGVCAWGGNRRTPAPAWAEHPASKNGAHDQFAAS